MKNLIVIMLLAAAFCIAASEPAGVIRWEGESGETAVTETGHLEVFRCSPADRTVDLTLADRVAERGRRFLWTPSPDPFRGAGGARIPDAAQSADGSALILLETVGAAEGPFDTRIAVFDIRSGQIIRVYRLPKVRYTRLMTIPGSDDFLLADIGGAKAGIVRFSLRSGKAVARMQCRMFSDWMIMAGKLFLKDREEAVLRQYRLTDLMLERSAETEYPGGLLLPAGGGKILNAAGRPCAVEKIDPARSRLPQNQTGRFLRPPEDFNPESVLACGKQRQFSVWLRSGGAAWLLINQEFHRIADRITGQGAGQANGALFLGLQKDDMIGEFHPEESTQMIRSSPTGSVSPKTRGEVMKIFPDCNVKPGVIVLDHRGHIYRLQPQDRRRKWSKTLLFIPGK